jgi:L-ascorbate metabolism protein UlaG (beta-lactamase superfamily)
VAFAGGTVKLTPAWHSSSYGPDWKTPGVPAGLIVRFGGKTVYFAGDTCLFGDMRLIGEAGLDAAVLPIGDNFTMGVDDAARAVEFLGLPANVHPLPLRYLPADPAGRRSVRVEGRDDDLLQGSRLGPG